MNIAVLGIDLGKNSCSVVGLDPGGNVVLRRRLSRDGVVKLASSLPKCMAAMEACCGAHHLGRMLLEHGTPGALDVARVCTSLRQGRRRTMTGMRRRLPKRRHGPQ